MAIRDWFRRKPAIKIEAAGRLIASSDPIVNARLQKELATATPVRSAPELTAEEKAWDAGREAAWTVSRPAPNNQPLARETAAAKPVSLIDRAARTRHLYVIGKTGTGKTTLIKNLMRENFESGDGACFIDPHGDAALELVGLIPRERVADVIYLDPTRANCPAFNPLALAYEPAKLATDLVSVFEMFFGSSWGPRLQQLLYFSTLTLLRDRHPHTLRDLERVLLDPRYRSALIDRTDHERLRLYWDHQYDGDKASAPAVLNKLSQFLAPDSHLERLFTNTGNALDFREIMNGKILIANLAKGKLGDDPSRLLGGFLVAAFQSAALARVDVPEHERRPFYLYADEFQTYVTESFAAILSEARKYGLSLTLAHQTTAQLSPTIWHAITGNVATMVAFQISGDDASRITREMHSSQVRVRDRRDGRERTLSEFVTYAIESLDYFRDQYIEACDRSDIFPNNSAPAHWPRGEAALFGDYKLRVDEIKRARTRLQTGGVAASTIRDLVAMRLEKCREHDLEGTANIAFAAARPFERFEVTEEAYPSVQDLTNLVPLKAYIRTGTADNVRQITIPYAPESSREITAEILARPAPAAPAVAPERDNAVAPAPVRDKPQPVAAKKYSDDDFSF